MSDSWDVADEGPSTDAPPRVHQEKRIQLKRAPSPQTVPGFPQPGVILPLEQPRITFGQPPKSIPRVMVNNAIRSPGRAIARTTHAGWRPSVTWIFGKESADPATRSATQGGQIWRSWQVTTTAWHPKIVASNILVTARRPH